MDFETFKKTFGKNGGRRYPASEYSDRVINRNRLEDRNYENACKLIEKERRTVLTTINKDIKKLEWELEVRQGLMRTRYDKERLKLLKEFPYKLRSSDDGYLRQLEELGLADNPHYMSASAGTKKPRYPDRVKKVHSAHGRFGGRGDHGGTVSNLTNIVSQSETTDPTPRTQRSASAFENYDFNEAVSEIKPVLMSNRANRSVIEASKQELYTPRIGSEINRSNSINELRSESSPTTPTKLPALLPTDTIQIRPKDLKLVKLGRQSRSLESSSDQDAASSPASSTESYQIVMPSTQGTQSPVVSNRFNYSPTALKSRSPSLIMPLPLAPNDRLPSMDADNNLDSNLSQLINSEVPISTTSPTRENRHNHASTGRITSHHVHHSSQGHGTKKKSRNNSSIKTQY